MDRKLLFQAITKFLSGVLLTGLLLFWPAGTLDYPWGWLFLAILFIPMFLAGLVMLAKAPDLLRSRLQAKEEQSEQKTVVTLSGLMFIAGFLLAGFNFRYSWCSFPRWVTVAAAVIFLLAYGLYAEVLRENAYLSRTIRVQENQQVVSTGLYGIIRHPMYAATLLLFLSMPLVLNSPLTFLIFLCYPAIIVKRIKNEEQLLSRCFFHRQGKSPWKTAGFRLYPRDFPRFTAFARQKSGGVFHIFTQNAGKSPLAPCSLFTIPL